jgi:hypothetical protein
MSDEGLNDREVGYGRPPKARATGCAAILYHGQRPRRQPSGLGHSAWERIVLICSAARHGVILAIRRT